MGKFLKTSMDEKVIHYLAIELHKLDPDNDTLNRLRSMQNDNGFELDKVLKEYDKTKTYPKHYNTDGTWKNPPGESTIWPGQSVRS